jgi:hypothetical protein
MVKTKRITVKIGYIRMELDLQSLFGLLCTAVLIGWDPAFGLLYEGAIGQPR